MPQPAFRCRPPARLTLSEDTEDQLLDASEEEDDEEELDDAEEADEADADGEEDDDDEEDDDEAESPRRGRRS